MLALHRQYGPVLIHGAFRSDFRSLPGLINFPLYTHYPRDGGLTNSLHLIAHDG
jgi:hypothetical protein